MQMTDTSFAMMEYIAGTDQTSAAERAEFISDVKKMKGRSGANGVASGARVLEASASPMFERIANRSETARRVSAITATTSA